MKTYNIKKTRVLTTMLILFLALFANVSAQKKRNAFGQEHYTVESAHFRIHYHRGLDHLLPRTADKLEELYKIFTETYHIVLPQKTDVVLYESEIPDGFAYVNFYFIYVGVHDYEFNLRGSSDWFDDVLTHEYAHIVSLQTGLKLPSIIPAIQIGYFTHPNARTRFEGLHLFPSETMPIWFVEGIAQYESNRHGSDSWDTHRDMILRTRSLSGNMLSWSHMQVFAGKGDEYEMTYNHGFSLIKYISETYGYDKIVSILRENSRITRLTFDGSVKAVLGISAKQLYEEWQESLRSKYSVQVRELGNQVFGRKINREGYDNLYPKFSHNDSLIYFVSNGDNDYSIRSLYSYNLSNTIPPSERIRYESGNIKSKFDMHFESGKVAYVSMKSPKSVQEPSMGGQQLFDLFIDSFPYQRTFFGRKTERQVTEQKSVFAASFSPEGDMLAVALRKFDRFYLALVDTSGENMRIVYPRIKPEDEEIFFNSTSLPEEIYGASFSTIFSVAWSPNGKDIALDFIDGEKRKIGVYDTIAKSFSVLFDDGLHDRRNPSFNNSGDVLYFSSDETGIFNIYRYAMKRETLQQITNVSGGAFHPAVSNCESKLAYSNYDRNGYGIYLIDTIQTLSETFIPRGNAFSSHNKREEKTYDTPLSNRRTYSRLPRQWLVIPTIVAEQLVTQNKDETKGVTHVKGGVVVNFMDPLAWSGVGNEGGAFLLIDLPHIFNFIDFDNRLISLDASYDAGAFFTSRVLPVTIDAEVTVRGIAGKDDFYEESYDSIMVLPYQIQLTNALLGVSHPLGELFYGQIFIGADRYDVALDLEETDGIGVFPYNLSYGYRIGAMTYFGIQNRNSTSNISPTGIAGKLQYSLWKQYSLKEENSFAIESSVMKEQYDDYLFHQIDARLFMGMPFLYNNMHIKLSGSYLKPIGDDDIPSFYLPAAHVPGYMFFFKDEKTTVDEHGTQTTMRHDTVLVSNRAVFTGEFSYRFPIFPNRIDKKLGFIYFDKLYGALNFSGGAGFEKPGDLFNWNRADWLLSYGAEARLETISFNNYPLSMKFRWDYGMDRTSRETFVDDRGIILGGHRFAFTLGFEFDDWHMIGMVDYFAPARYRQHNKRERLTR